MEELFDTFGIHVAFQTQVNDGYFKRFLVQTTPAFSFFKIYARSSFSSWVGFMYTERRKTYRLVSQPPPFYAYKKRTCKAF
jgi:hypothetical protein